MKSSSYHVIGDDDDDDCNRETRWFIVCIIHWRFIKLNAICFQGNIFLALSCSSKKKVKTKGKIQHPDKLHKIKANVYVDTSHHQQRKYPESLKEKKLNLNCETC